MKYVNSEGEFDAVVTEPTAGWIGLQGKDETPFIRIPVMITSEGTEKGNGIVWQGWLTEKAFENTIARLSEVFAFNGNLSGLTAGKQTLVGLPCNIVTEFETYEGKQRCKVKWLNAPGGGRSKPIDKTKLDLLLGKLNTRAMAVAAEITGKEAEGDVPF